VVLQMHQWDLLVRTMRCWCRQRLLPQIVLTRHRLARLLGRSRRYL